MVRGEGSRDEKDKDASVKSVDKSGVAEIWYRQERKDLLRGDPTEGTGYLGEEQLQVAQCPTQVA